MVDRYVKTKDYKVWETYTPDFDKYVESQNYNLDESRKNGFVAVANVRQISLELKDGSIILNFDKSTGLKPIKLLYVENNDYQKIKAFLKP